MELLPLECHVRAGEDGEQLAWVRVDLRFHGSALGWKYTRHRVQLKEPQVPPFRAARLVERADEHTPHVRGRLGREPSAPPTAFLVGEDRGVQRVADVLDVVARDCAERLCADARMNP